ncbi:MAG: hypothetical protein ABIQ54_04015 [Gammaproteobacteria bacterium]
MEKKLIFALATTLLSGAALAGSYNSSTGTGGGSSSGTGVSAHGSAHAGMSGMPLFDSLDTNKDGSLSKSEYDVGMRSHQFDMHHSKTHSMDKSGMRDSGNNTTSDIESRSTTGASADSSTGDAGASVDLSGSGMDSSVSGGGDVTSRNPLTEQHVP